MPGQGPVPKPAHLRQRRNASTTRAALPSAEESARNRVPALPKRARGTGKWHSMVIRWWRSVWLSPMATEYLDADMAGGLYLLAELHQVRWTTRDTAELVKVSAEIRLQEVRFGLSPIDRRRLQWEVDKGDVAEEKTASRRRKSAPPTEPAADPRDVLKVVA